MSSQVTLSGGAMHDSGFFYLLVAEGEADEDTSRLSRGWREGKVIRLEMLSEAEEFVSIDTLSGALHELGEVVALTAEGGITFAGASAVTNEIVTGAGYSRPDSQGMGRMTTVRECRGSLFAMGFGGQVYRRTFLKTWQPLGPEQLGLPRPSYYTVAPGRNDSELVFGGVRISEYTETDDILAAEESRDASLLADLILDSLEADVPLISTLDEDWKHLELTGTGVVDPILKMPDRWLIFMSSGVILETFDLSSFGELRSPSRPRPYSDIKLWMGRPVLLIGNLMFTLIDGVMEPFDPPMPRRKSRCLSLWSSDAGLAALHESEVLLLRDGKWEVLGLQRD